MKEVWRCRLRKKWAYQTSVACCSSPPGGMGCEATSATHITLQNLKLNCAGLRHILDEDEEHVLLKKRTTSEVLLWFCYLPRQLDLQDRAILRIHLAKLRAMVLWLNWWASRTWIQLWRREDMKPKKLDFLGMKKTHVLRVVWSKSHVFYHNLRKCFGLQCNVQSQAVLLCFAALLYLSLYTSNPPLKLVIYTIFFSLTVMSWSAQMLIL